MKLKTNTITAALKAGRHSDGRNLYLQVTATGAKSWLYIYRAANGKQRELGLGSFTGAGAAVAVSLAQARLAADRARAQLQAGLDPIEQKIAAKLEAVVSLTTFADMVALYVKHNIGGWKVKHGVCGHAKDVEGKMSLHAAKLMGKRVATVTVEDVVAALEPIWAKDVGERVRYIIEQVMQKAIGNGHYKGANPALIETVTSRLGGVYEGSGKNQPSLAFAKLPGVIEQLMAESRMAAKASIFCTLTATRSDESRLMKWSEIKDGVWTVPAWRMKVKTKKDQAGDHLVPLSDAAIALLKSIPQRADNDYVFFGTLKGQPVGKGSLNDMIAKDRSRGGLLALQGEATQHGMRSTFSTWANESKGYDENDVERCLAHVVGNKVSRVYNKAERLAERRAIMQAWGEACMGRATSNVVEGDFRRAA